MEDLGHAQHQGQTVGWASDVDWLETVKVLKQYGSVTTPLKRARFTPTNSYQPHRVRASANGVSGPQAQGAAKSDAASKCQRLDRRHARQAPITNVNVPQVLQMRPSYVARWPMPGRQRHRAPSRRTGGLHAARHRPARHSRGRATGFVRPLPQPLSAACGRAGPLCRADHCRLRDADAGSGPSADEVHVELEELPAISMSSPPCGRTVRAS